MVRRKVPRTDGGTSRSQSIMNTRSPRAQVRPASAARWWPKLRARSTRRTRGSRACWARTKAAEPSGEPSLTKTISWSSNPASASACRACSRKAERKGSERYIIVTTLIARRGAWRAPARGWPRTMSAPSVMDARGREPWRRGDSKRRLELRQQREQVAHQADVGDLVDRRVRILVERHERAGVLDAGQVLDRAGDAHRQVQLGGDDLAGLADLQLVRDVAGVDRRARGAHRRAELVGQLVDDVEVLLRPHAATARHHPPGALQVGADGLALGQADEAGVGGQGGGGVRCLDRRAAVARGFRP